MILSPSACCLSHQPLHKPASDRLICRLPSSRSQKESGDKSYYVYFSPTWTDEFRAFATASCDKLFGSISFDTKVDKRSLWQVLIALSSAKAAEMDRHSTSLLKLYSYYPRLATTLFHGHGMFLYVFIMICPRLTELDGISASRQQQRFSANT